MDLGYMAAATEMTAASAAALKSNCTGGPDKAPTDYGITSGDSRRRRFITSGTGGMTLSADRAPGPRGFTRSCWVSPDRPPQPSIQDGAGGTRTARRRAGLLDLDHARFIQTASGWGAIRPNQAGCWNADSYSNDH